MERCSRTWACCRQRCSLSPPPGWARWAPPRPTVRRTVQERAGISTMCSRSRMGSWRSSSAMCPDTDGRRCRKRRSCASRCGHTSRPVSRRGPPSKRLELCSSASLVGHLSPSWRPPISRVSASSPTPAPVIHHQSCSARGRSHSIVVSSSPPIGAGFRTGTRQTVVSVPGRSQICFHTDGITEARVAGELFGAERLAGTLAELGPRATASALLEQVTEETDARPDDMAACLLNVEGRRRRADDPRRGVEARPRGGRGRSNRAIPPCLWSRAPRGR